jgi:hypothetical protein
MKARFQFHPGDVAVTVEGGWLVAEAEGRPIFAYAEFGGRRYKLTTQGDRLSIQEELDLRRPRLKARLATEPDAFNPDYRPGLAEALDQAYTAHCEANPEATRDELSAAYLKLHAYLLPSFPRVG